MTARLRHLRYRDLDGLARDRLDHMKASLDVGDVEGLVSYEFTADNLTDLITITGQDNLAGNTPRVVLVGDLPAELATGVIYYLADAGLNLYSLHTSKEDAGVPQNPVTFTDNGTGTLSLFLLD